MRILILAGAVTAAAVHAPAQLSHTIPLGTATVPGNSSNAFPWGADASTWPGLRLMAVYDSTNFTGGTINFPIIITRLKWRVNDGTTSWTGGTYAASTVSLSTAPIDWTQVTTNFAGNHGPDLATVYSGPVTIAGGTSNGPGIVPPTVVDITLTTPFLYDPAAGDLVIDVDYPGGSNWSGGTAPGQMDVQATGSNAARIFASSMYPVANGTTQNHGPVVEMEYLPSSGYAYFASYGTGCGGGGPPGIYEVFDGQTRVNDLANTGIQLQPVPGAFIAIQGASAIVPATGTPLSLGLNQTVPVTLPWSFPHPTGSTTTLWVCSNGWIALESTTATENVESFGLLRAGPARVCAFWDDFAPGGSGTVHAAADPASNGLFHVTWTNVGENATPSGANTFQATFSQSGSIELKWGVMSAVDGLVGYHPGNGAGDPGQTDISALTALILGDGRDPLSIRAQSGSRPVLGQAFTTRISGIPSGSPIGALVLGVAQFNPGVPLAPVGMPGCSQYASIDATFVWLPTAAPTFSLPLNVPNVPSAAGTALYSQCAVWATGFNPLGIITSNGGTWNLHTQ